MTEHLTIPDQALAARKTVSASCSGQNYLGEMLQRTPLAQSERGRPKGVDAVHLKFWVGTDYCQWFGRRADGRFHPIGRIMEIIRTAENAT